MGLYMSEVNTVAVEKFLAEPDAGAILDVRSPAEYIRGCIPGAHNLPLFTDDEREQVGLTYHRLGREAAVKTGLDITGPRLRSYVEKVEQIADQKSVRIYCWRGGMRSGSLAWLLSTAGFRVLRLDGGYKAYRHYVLESFELPRKIFILSGPTGSGKTAILMELKELGEQVLDLEGLAKHKGSTFGALGEDPQPPQQLFENMLAGQWRRFDPQRPVWIEDESQRIGRRMIPQPLWEQMRAAPVFFLDMARELRVQRLVNDYGGFPVEELAGGVTRVKNRLGGANARAAAEALERGDLAECCRILLSYYDKTYRYGLSRRDQSRVHPVIPTSIDPVENARLLLKRARDLQASLV